MTEKYITDEIFKVFKKGDESYNLNKEELYAIIGETRNEVYDEIKSFRDEELKIKASPFNISRQELLLNLSNKMGEINAKTLKLNSEVKR